MLPRKLSLWFLLTMCLAGCRSSAPLPDLPAVDFAPLQPAVRESISYALAAAQAQPRNAGTVARLGMVLHAHDRFGAAAICYQRAHTLDPRNFDYAYYWGSALAAEGKYVEALVPLRRALVSDKNSVPARLKLADALLAAGQTQEAGEEYCKVLAQDADNPAASYGFGRSQKGAAAIAAFTKALILFPRYGAAQFALAAAYRAAGNTAKAEETLAGYEHNKSNTPPLDDPLMGAVYTMNAGAAGLLRQAKVLEREDRLSEAVTLQEKALEQDPKLVQAWINLISLHGRLGQFDKAEAAFRKALDIAPNQADVHYNFGVLCLKLERIDEARKAFQKAVQLDPRHADALHNLGSLVEDSGQLDAAAHLYEQALAAMPEHRPARFQLGRIYANQRRYAQAITEFEKLQEPIDAQSATYLYALGATHARAGHRKQSIEILQRARQQAEKSGQREIASAVDRDLAALEVHP